MSRCGPIRFRHAHKHPKATGCSAHVSRYVHRSSQHIERAKLHFVIVLAGMQSVEIGISVNAQDDRLAIDDKALLPVFQRRFSDPWIAFGPVIAAFGYEPHAVAVAFHAEAIAVVYFVEPGRAGTFVPVVGMQNSNALNMEPKWAVTGDFANL
jgi:hypothetical protein